MAQRPLLKIKTVERTGQVPFQEVECELRRAVEPACTITEKEGVHSSSPRRAGRDLAELRDDVPDAILAEHREAI